MKHKCRISFPALLLLCLALAVPLYSQDFQLVFLDGSADIRSGGQWAPLQIGDTAPARSTIRVLPGAIAEFAGPGDTLLFSSPGTYQLEVAGRSGDARISTASSIFNRLTRAGGENDPGRSQAMGVRGSEAVEATAFTWVDEDSINFDEALEAFREEDYLLAIDILENEVDPIVLDDQGAYWYYLAASYDSIGRMGPALQVLRNNQPESYSTVSGDFLFLKGRLALESRSYREAADALETFIEQESDPARKQLAWYLLGYCRIELGEKAAGEMAVREAITINADSEITAFARNLLP
jgi:tetratricopeptide (TPR) repeat protein